MNLSNVKFKEIRQSTVDGIMLILLLVNLSLLAFDWMFQQPFVQMKLQRYASSFYVVYNKYVHQYIFVYDLVFVIIYLLEFFIRWILAVIRRTYHKWFFFPFIHWFDLLGCIPSGNFRLLRLLRVIIILYRWQRQGIIDLSKSYLSGTLVKYYEIVMEEITDKVIINIIESVQDGARRGSPVVDKIVKEVVRPQKQFLVDWLSHRVSTVVSHMKQNHGDELRTYIHESVQNAMDNNKELKDIDKIPILGTMITSRIERSVRDIVYRVVENVMQDLASYQNNAMVDDIADALFEAILRHEQDQNLNKIAIEIFCQSLEIIKNQVKIQQWKIKEMEAVILSEERRKKNEEFDNNNFE
ncbi:MAG: hypothetical protein OHK0038_00690 [Flammeovirgaceae bacterium]